MKAAGDADALPAVRARRWRWVSRGVRAGLVVLAAWALHRELIGVNAGALLTELRGFGAARIALAGAATIVSFVVLGGIEVMALGYLRLLDVVPRRTGLVTGFVANALSQSMGVALLTGAAVRVRAYRRYGVDSGEIARLSAFVTVTATLGLMATGAGAFLASSAPLQLWHLLVPMRVVGAVLAATVAAYLAWSTIGTRRTVGHGAWRIVRPRLRVALGQIALASVDWLVTGSLLFLVLPAAIGIKFFTVLRVYLVAQTVGTASHVPGGAGVFDLVILALLLPLAGPASRAAIVASLVAFRVLYYLAPLVVACAVAAAAEMRAPGLARAT